MAAIEINAPRTVNATKLKVDADVRYWEDATVNGVEDEDGTLIPFRVGDAWCPTFNIDEGTIENWPAGTTASIHYKVCDAGIYALIGEDGEMLIHKDGYVPSILSPGGDGYGDYIIMSIDAAGKIANWQPDLSYFED